MTFLLYLPLIIMAFTRLVLTTPKYPPTRYLKTPLPTQRYAHFPSTLIRTIPVSSANIASTVRTRPAVSSFPCSQSLANISTIPTHAKIPADSASSVPIAMIVLGSFPLNS